MAKERVHIAITSPIQLNTSLSEMEGVKNLPGSWGYRNYAPTELFGCCVHPALLPILRSYGAIWLGGTLHYYRYYAPTELFGCCVHPALLPILRSYGAIWLGGTLHYYRYYAPPELNGWGAPSLLPILRSYGAPGLLGGTLVATKSTLLRSWYPLKYGNWNARAKRAPGTWSLDP